MAAFGPTPKPVSERLLARRTIDEQGCWLWQGPVRGYGYGYIHVGKRLNGRSHNVNVHRLAYEIWVGPIPEGLEIDHLCLVPRCFNPEHLRAVTSKQNHENRSQRSDLGRSGFRGVIWDKSRNKWRAHAIHLGKGYYGGDFADVEEAARAAAALRNTLYTHNEADRLVP